MSVERKSVRKINRTIQQDERYRRASKTAEGIVCRVGGGVTE